MLRAIIFSGFLLFSGLSPYYTVAHALETSTLPHPPATIPSFADDALLDKDVGLNALVRLERADGYVCTGIAIRTNENPQSPAFVISAGHCHSLLYGEVITNLIPKGRKKLKAIFNQFHDANASEKFTIHVKKISYASMRGHDLAIFELNATQGELAARNILLPKLANTLPLGLSITSYGNRANDPLMRTVNCTLKDQVNLNEGKWLWWNALRAECTKADLISGGASGSPVYVQGTASELFGILNTINVSPKTNVLCSENNPCELKEPKPISRLNAVYLMDVHKLRHCFTAEGEFNHQLKFCPLPKHLAVYTEFKRVPDPNINPVDQLYFDLQARYPNPAYAQTNYVFKGTLATQAYQMQLVKPAQNATEAYRYKLSPLASFDPYDASAYSEPTRSLSVSIPYPNAAGTYIASIVPVRSYNTNRLNPLALYTDIFEIVYKNPLKIKKIKFTGNANFNLKKLKIDKVDGNQIQINSLKFFGHQVGKKANTNCSDFNKYIISYYNHSMELMVEALKSGDKLCLVLVDRALNASEPFEYIQP